jgi:hypothetical protein
MKKVLVRYVLYPLYRLYAEVYSRYQEATNPRWQQEIGEVPCQYCGENHKEAYCPKARSLGLLPDDED